MRQPIFCCVENKNVYKKKIRMYIKITVDKTVKMLYNIEKVNVWLFLSGRNVKWI